MSFYPGKHTPGTAENLRAYAKSLPPVHVSVPMLLDAAMRLEASGDPYNDPALAIIGPEPGVKKVTMRGNRTRESVELSDVFDIVFGDERTDTALRVQPDPDCPGAILVTCSNPILLLPGGTNRVRIIARKSEGL